MSENGLQPIFLVIGPPAVGKSTTSRALAACFAKSIHIPVDDIRHMVVSGLRLPSPAEDESLKEQIALARKSVAQMALNYHQAGFVVVMDDFWGMGDLADYGPLLRQPELRKIVLCPSQHAAHERNFKRSGGSPARAYIDEGIALVYQGLNAAAPQLEQEGWNLVDSSALSVEETVRTILDQAQQL